jgi:hypothetical protein
MMRQIALAAAMLALLGTSPEGLDSQYVLQRYALELGDVTVPKVVVFAYAISQAGLGNIEQRHVVYRSGTDVRDETLAVDGVSLVQKRVRIEQRADHYSIDRMAPRADAYQLLFLRTVKDGSHVDYVYDASPLVKTSDTWVDRVTIDGVKFLPRSIHFQTATGEAKGSGAISYAPVGKFWMPVDVSVEATVNGKPARERIALSDYRFPPSLPPSTFTPPHALPAATLPPI